MKITKVIPIVHREFPNVIHVEVHTDEGFIGLGERLTISGRLSLTSFENLWHLQLSVRTP
jgi:L-alanine-DL-glutamate epimerase-like enolase superfamily enzyme